MNRVIETGKELLTEEDISFYREHGYLIGPQLFDAEGVEDLRRQVKRMLDGERDFDGMQYFGFYGNSQLEAGSDEVQFVFNGWWVNERLRGIIQEGELGRMAALLLGTPEVRLTLDQTIWKPPLSRDNPDPEKTVVGWHQDAAHFSVFNSPGFVTAWIALQDTDCSNGCMKFVNGSHKWGLIRESATFFEKDLDALKARFHTEGRRWVEKDIILKAGQVSFHDGLTMHGSRANLSDKPRLSIVFHIMSQGTTYNRFGEYNPLGVQMGPYVNHGDLCAEPWFPRMWPVRGNPHD